MNEQKGIARPRMPAEHNDRAGQPGRLLHGAKCWFVHLDPDPEHAGTRPEYQVKEPPHDRVMAALVRLCAEPATEPAGYPQAQAHEQRGSLGQEPDEREAQQPKAAHAATPGEPGHPEPQGQQRKQHHEGDRDDNRQRRQHESANQPGWDHGRLLPSRWRGQRPGNSAR